MTNGNGASSHFGLEMCPGDGLNVPTGLYRVNGPDVRAPAHEGFGIRHGTALQPIVNESSDSTAGRLLQQVFALSRDAQMLFLNVFGDLPRHF